LFILKKVCSDNTLWIDFLKKFENLLSEYESCIYLELIGFQDKYLSFLKE